MAIAGATGDVDVLVAWVWANLVLVLVLLLRILGSSSSLDERRFHTEVDSNLQELATSTC